MALLSYQPLIWKFCKIFYSWDCTMRNSLFYLFYDELKNILATESEYDVWEPVSNVSSNFNL